MGNKFSNKCIWVLMLVLGVFVVAVTALIGGNSSIRNAQQTAQRTLQYLQNQCISYRDTVAADRLKSLVRLTEQAQEVRIARVWWDRTVPTRSWRGTPSVSA